MAFSLHQKYFQIEHGPPPRRKLHLYNEWFTFLHFLAAAMWHQKRSSIDGLKFLESYWLCQPLLLPVVWSQAMVRLINVSGKLHMELYMGQKKGFYGSLDQDCACRNTLEIVVSHWHKSALSPFAIQERGQDYVTSEGTNSRLSS